MPHIGDEYRYILQQRDCSESAEFLSFICACSIVFGCEMLQIGKKDPQNQRPKAHSCDCE
uniref:Uncharacterized protein n=1 Tax=Arundo donax TaxID=35708 RepID=A0A0A9HEM3_ARUDO